MGDTNQTTRKAKKLTWGTKDFAIEVNSNVENAQAAISIAQATQISVKEDIIAMVTVASDENGNFGVHTEDMPTTALPLRAKSWDVPVKLGQRVELRKSFGKKKEQGDGYWVNLRLLRVLD